MRAGDRLFEGLTEGLKLSEGLNDGDRLGLIDFEIDFETEGDLEGLIDLDTDVEGEGETLVLNEGLMDLETDLEGDIEGLTCLNLTVYKGDIARLPLTPNLDTEGE